MRFSHLFLLILLSLLIFSFTSFSFAYSFTGNVTHVFDGDTIKVNNRYTVRFYGIDTPEKKQEFGPEAKQYLSNLIYGKKVTVKYKNKDQYGRAVGKVFCNGEFINLEMVKAGYAWYYRQYAPNDTYFSAAQFHAEANKLGLWKQKSPVPPWQWRKDSRKNTPDDMMKEILHGFLYSTGNMGTVLISGVKKLGLISNETASSLKTYTSKLKNYSRYRLGYSSGYTGFYKNELGRMIGLVLGYGGIFILLFIFYIIAILKNRGNRAAAKATIYNYIGNIFYCFACVVLLLFFYKLIMSGNIKESISSLSPYNIKFIITFLILLIFGFLLKMKAKKDLPQKPDKKKKDSDKTAKKTKIKK
ncbi:MAG: thermonuclease family protein [bacterium]|nr:thermonuclease family protein [bacterium]